MWFRNRASPQSRPARVQQRVGHNTWAGNCQKITSIADSGSLSSAWAAAGAAAGAGATTGVIGVSIRVYTGRGGGSVRPTTATRKPKTAPSFRIRAVACEQGSSLHDRQPSGPERQSANCREECYPLSSRSAAQECYPLSTDHNDTRLAQRRACSADIPVGGRRWHAPGAQYPSSAPTASRDKQNGLRP